MQHVTPNCENIERPYFYDWVQTNVFSYFSNFPSDGISFWYLQCCEHLEMLLDNIPTMFESNRIADSALGAAVKVWAHIVFLSLYFLTYVVCRRLAVV